jgi:hypothetical protein
VYHYGVPLLQPHSATVIATRLTQTGRRLKRPPVQSDVLRRSPAIDRSHCLNYGAERTSAGVHGQQWHRPRGLDVAAATGPDDDDADALDAAARHAASRGAPLVAAAAWEPVAQLSSAPGTRAARYVAAAEAALHGGDADRAGRLASMSAAAQQRPGHDQPGQPTPADARSMINLG